MTMQRNNRRAFTAIRPILDFLERHPLEAAGADLKVHQKALAESLNRMAQLAEDREAGLSTRGQQVEAIRTLSRRVEREFLTPVRRVRRQLAGVTDQVRGVVSARRQPSLALLTAAGRAVAQAARENPDAFAAAGMLPDFAARLTATLDELDKERSARAQRMAELSGGTAAFRAEAKRGRFLVALLDGVVTPLLERDAGLLGEWKSLRRRAVWLTRADLPEELPPTAVSGEQARAA